MSTVQNARPAGDDRTEHPQWCHRQGCAERGYHESAPVPCNADPTLERMESYVVPPGERRPLDEPAEVLIVQAVLTQDLDHGRTLPTVYLEIAFFDVPEDRDAVLLTPQQAQLVIAGLTQLLRVGGL